MTPTHILVPIEKFEVIKNDENASFNLSTLLIISPKVDLSEEGIHTNSTASEGEYCIDYNKSIAANYERGYKRCAKDLLKQ